MLESSPKCSLFQDAARQQLYFEASEAAATIATSKDSTVRQKAEAKFWILFWGPLVMVEREEVSGAMKNFGYCLDGTEKCSTDEMKQRSLKLSSALETSLLRTWNANPDGFTKDQFIYR